MSVCVFVCVCVCVLQAIWRMYWTKSAIIAKQKAQN
jgi:cell division protein FtsL